MVDNKAPCKDFLHQSLPDVLCLRSSLTTFACKLLNYYVIHHRHCLFYDIKHLNERIVPGTSFSVENHLFYSVHRCDYSWPRNNLTLADQNNRNYIYSTNLKKEKL